jgi:hypothetical protein
MEKRKTRNERKKESLARLDSELFRKVVIDLLQLSKTNAIALDILPHKFYMSYSDKTQRSLLKKYKLNEKTFSEYIEVLSDVFHYLLDESEEAFFSLLGNDTNLVAKAKNLMDFVKGIDQYANIQNRYLIVNFCKTKYFDEIDWEINFKNLQKEVGEEKKPKPFPCCVVRLCLQSPPTRQKHIAEKEPETTSMELSYSDVVQLADAFSEIKQNMKNMIEGKQESC